MTVFPPGSIAVIFCAARNTSDEPGYTQAAAEMSELASRQPGYLGQEHARSENRFGITVSFWKDEESVKAWRDHPDHVAIREKGRGIWYDDYTLHIAKIEHGYDWQK